MKNVNNRVQPQGIAWHMLNLLSISVWLVLLIKMLLIKKRVLHKNLNDMRLHFFYKKVGPSLQSCLYFQDDFFTYVCEEYNNFHDSRSIFMISDFKIFLIIFSAEF